MNVSQQIKYIVLEKIEEQGNPKRSRIHFHYLLPHIVL